MLSCFRQRTMTFVAETGKLRVERKALYLLCRNRKRWGTAVTNFNVTVITLAIGNTTINVAREIYRENHIYHGVCMYSYRY